MRSPKNVARQQRESGWYDVAMKEKRARGKNRRKEERDEERPERRISPEVLRGVSALFCIALAGFLILAGAGKGGVVGETLYEWLSYILGVGYLLLPLSLLLLGIAIVRSFERHFGIVQFGSMVVFLAAALALVNIGFPGRSGVLGTVIANPIVAAVDTTAAIIFFATFIIAALIIAFNIHLGIVFSTLREWFRKSEEEVSEEPAVVGLPDEEQEPVVEVPSEIKTGEEPEEKKKGAIARFLDKGQDTPEGFAIIAATGSAYIPPPVSILAKNKGKPEVGDVKANMNIIKRTLQNFGIQV